MSDIVQLRTYLTRAEDLAMFFSMRDDLYSKIFPDRAYPTHTLLIVAGLFESDLLIEIEAIALF
jgi:enamine deaminase RidA (YjgF/YER057c/UK114 family)